MSLVLGQKFMLFTGKDYDSLRVKASEAAPLFVSAGFTKERKRAVFKHFKKKSNNPLQRDLNFEIDRRSVHVHHQLQGSKKKERKRSFAKGHFEVWTVFLVSFVFIFVSTQLLESTGVIHSVIDSDF